MPPTDDLADAARAVAATAADHADVEVEDLVAGDGTGEVAALLAGAVDPPGPVRSVPDADELGAMLADGGHVAVARRHGTAVGAVAATVATADTAVDAVDAEGAGGTGGAGGAGRHLRTVAVAVTTTGRGLGTALAWHQRAWSLARDLPEVRWTVDPASRREVAFSLARLGAQVDGYLEDVGGRAGNGPATGTPPADRLEIRWVLTSPRVRAAATGRAASPDVDALRRSGARIVLDRLPDGSPHLMPTAAPRRLVHVPPDIDHLRTQDPELARAWSVALRVALGDALGAGARVTGATRDGWLVLAGREQVTDLTGGTRHA